MLLFIHGAGREGAPEGTFQYITCYSLSNPGMQGPVGRLWFQYITCYSLSKCQKIARWKYEVSIHHMLLFIFTASLVLHRQFCFNTSHVTLYLNSPSKKTFKIGFQYITCYSLSMDAYVVMQDHIKFQYITCYSLSRSGEKTRDLADVSIHHMLLFIVHQHLQPRIS